MVRAGIRTLTIIATLAVGVIAAPMSSAVAQDAKSDWREQNAYTLGVQAYLYGSPWAYMPVARWPRTEAMGSQADRLDHVRKLDDAGHLNGGAPNNDSCIRVHGYTSRTSHTSCRSRKSPIAITNGDRGLHGR